MYLLPCATNIGHIQCSLMGVGGNYLTDTEQVQPNSQLSRILTTQFSMILNKVFVCYKSFEYIRDHYLPYMTGEFAELFRRKMGL